jgi:hypothetical protein
MVSLNLLAVWIGILLGMTAGAVQGLWFHHPHWLGGYQAWPRRLARLGHISFFGLAFVNLAFWITVRGLFPESTDPLPVFIAAASYLLVAGAVLMPLVCYLAAWHVRFRLFFPLPVGCLLAGVCCLLIGGLAP